MRNLPEIWRSLGLVLSLCAAQGGWGQQLPHGWNTSVQRSAQWALETATRLHPAPPSCPAWLPEVVASRSEAVDAVLEQLGDAHTAVARRPQADRLARTYGVLPFEVVRTVDGMIVRKSTAENLPVGATLLAVNGRDAAEVAPGWPDGFVNEVVAAECGVRAGETLLLRWVDPMRGDTVSGAVEVGRDRRVRRAAGGSGWVEAFEGGVVLKPAVFRTQPGAWEELPRTGGMVWDLRGHAGGGVQEAVVLARRLTGYEGPLPQAVVVKGSAEARRLQPGRLQPGGGEDWEAVWTAVQTLPDGAVDTVRFSERGPAGPVSTGRCAVLVDGGTSSAAAALADWLQRRGRAVVIGTPWAPSAGGTYGNAVRAVDPESGLEIRVATAAFVWDSTVWGPCALPGQPDLRLEPTGVAWAAERDPVLEAGMAWVSGLPWQPDSSSMASWMAHQAPERWALWRGIERELKPTGPWRQAAWNAIAEHAAEVAWVDLAAAQAERAPNPAQAERAPNPAQAERAPNPAQAERAPNPAQAERAPSEARAAARQKRDAALRAACPAPDATALERLLNPAKPAVLHFGIHDRMNCGVCKPGEQ